MRQSLGGSSSRPSRNSTNSSKGTLSSQKPSVASAMITTSNSFTRRICTDFSNLSANSPAVAENRK